MPKWGGDGSSSSASADIINLDQHEPPYCIFLQHDLFRVMLFNRTSHQTVTGLKLVELVAGECAAYALLQNRKMVVVKFRLFRVAGEIENIELWQGQVKRAGIDQYMMIHHPQSTEQ